jgi:hypothetical protein
VVDPLAAAALVDPAARVVTAGLELTVMAAAAAARAGRHLLLAQQERVPLAVLVAQGELQALEVPEPQ